jgi:hypothetical protein
MDVVSRRAAVKLAAAGVASVSGLPGVPHPGAGDARSSTGTLLVAEHEERLQVGHNSFTDGHRGLVIEPLAQHRLVSTA